jgi:hypothetical protein
MKEIRRDLVIWLFPFTKGNAVLGRKEGPQGEKDGKE